MPFSPIAIVGRGCVLPGALNPQEYWQLLNSGRTAIGPAATGSWRLDHQRVAATRSDQLDHTVSNHGGYVSGFEPRFDASGFVLSPDEIRRQEPVVQWLLECSRQALSSCSLTGVTSSRQAVILGNLGYPTAAQSRHAELVWLQANGVGSANDIESRSNVVPLPDANLAGSVAGALGITGDSFTIDAACASSIYAIDLACRALQDGRVDLALAGGANNSDDLFLHIGFTALRALSPTGFSRPFGSQADGLIPAHGAALVALKRLEDAVEAGDSILAVIRGIGLSNDGRAGGFLSPSRAGQVRAIRAAYQSAELDPRDVHFVECHATGTTVGDGVELAALREVFDGAGELRIGSHKGNTGHAITAAGAAGLLKLLGMFQHQAFVSSVPSTSIRNEANEAPFRVCHHSERWESDGPRRAGLSAFGFGGANAHLIVEEYVPSRWITSETRSTLSDPRPTNEIAIVAACALTGSSSSWREFVENLAKPVSPGGSRAIRTIGVAAKDPGFPPRDLAMTLPQQVAMMSAVDMVLQGIDLPNDRTAVFIGTDVEHEISRYGARWRLPELAAEFIPEASDDWIQQAQPAFVASLEAAGVTGTMPNIAAHRLNVKHDLKGPGYTVSAGVLSGIRSLQIAVEGLKHGDFDAAVVGAVDLCCEAVHESAARWNGASPPGDAAVGFVLKRLSDAKASNDPILGTIDVETITAKRVRPSDLRAEIIQRFGDCGAASGLLELAAHCARSAFEKQGPLEFQAEGERVLRVGFRPMFERIHVAEETRARRMELPAHPPRIELPRLQSTVVNSRSAVARTATGQSAGHYKSAHSQNAVLVSGVHEQYVREMASSHQLFLAGRARAIGELLARGRARSNVGSRMESEVANIRIQPQLRRLDVTAPARQTPVEPPAPPDSGKPPTAAPERAGHADHRRPQGPQFSRSQLEVLAGGCISDVFGPLFRQQDGYRRQVRLPKPPLLLVDRVTGIDAEPGKHGTGTIWTETDVCWDSWYLHQGRMPAGIMIESGQADLLLISWMGADFLNRDQRVYRLLGCEATYYGALPRAGQTLQYQITIDGHARQGDVRLFFFHYDCYIDGELCLRVRHGQAGFFTDQELKNTDGILWTPESRDLADCRVEAPSIPCQHRQFHRDQIEQFYRGDLFACFGAGFECLQTHSRTPSIASPDLKLMDEISSFDPQGGPWQRGYLRAELAIHPDDWFFAGHFLNDPCMPGTLMFEACLHAMSFYVTALGFTTTHDGWRFEPVRDSTVTMQCRGQVTPESKRLSIEILVEEVVAGPDPILFADLLCTVDGVKAFYARRMGLRLAPDWPITSSPLPAADGSGVCRGSLRGDYAAFLECAWGRPSAAFGPSYEPFDTYRRTPRLPSPPYHFISRATRIDAEPDNVRPGSEVEVEYDVPRDAWYFDKSARPTMPIAVLMEANLQPCGWLAMMSGVVLKSRHELYFRNLDGTCTVFEEVTPEAGRLRTRVRLQRASTVGDTTIVFFETSCHVGERLIAKIETSFGFFTSASLSQQVGVSCGPEEQARINGYLQAGGPADTCDDSIAIPMLRMTDHVREYSADGGRNGQGHIHGEQVVDCSAWYFKAHFYQDPVQPGSLGVQALVNLLMEWLRRTHGQQFVTPHFEPVACDEQMVWTYRGQVVPTAGRVHQCVDILEVRRDESGIVAIAQGTLWVDGLSIYRIGKFAVRVCEGATGPQQKLVHEHLVDPREEPWWNDHSPTYAVPTMPLMGIANELARAARRFCPSATVVGIRNLSLGGWLTLASPVRLRFEGEVTDRHLDSSVSSIRIQLLTGEGSHSKPVANGIVLLADGYKSGPTSGINIDGLSELDDPYDNASLFHGPAFQLVKRLWSCRGRSVVEVCIDDCQVPADLIHPALLDAALHGVPHSNWGHWIPEVESGQVGFPVQLQEMDLFGPAPKGGCLLVEARLVDSNSVAKTQTIEIQVACSGQIWATMRIQERLFPMGEFSRNPLVELRSFIRDRAYRPGIALSRRDNATTRLTTADICSVNWLPGTVERIYGVSGTLNELVVQVAVREHVAQDWRVHPSAIDWDATSSTVHLRSSRSQSQRVSVTREGTEVTVRSL